MTRRIAVVAGVLGVLCTAAPARATLDSNCTVSVLNRTTQVRADGTWELPNIPANFGQVRARATCVENGGKTFAELIEAAEVCSLGQITDCLHETVGHFRPTV